MLLRRKTSCFLTWICLLSAVLLLPAGSGAQTITVNTFDDEFDDPANGTCSFREAVESIDTNGDFGGCTNPGGADTIALGPGTFTLDIDDVIGPANASGAVRFLTATNVVGAGSAQTTLQAAFSTPDGILEIAVGGGDDVSVSGLTLTGAALDAISIFPDSAGSTFSFTDVVVAGNGPEINSGAGMRIQGNFDMTVRIERSVFEDNQAQFFGGGLACRVSSGSATNVQVELLDVLFRNNRAVPTAPSNNLGDTTVGGGVAVAGCNLDLENVTFDSNAVTFNGGGLFVGDYFNTTSTATLTNVTFFGNSAESGGGLYASFGNTGSTFSTSMTNVTFGGNIAPDGAAFYNNGATVEATNVLFGEHSTNACDGNPMPNLTSQGGNRDADGSCDLGDASDTTGPSGLAVALADEGGFTPVLALEAGSPARDQGINATCPPGDQRGVARPQDGDGDDIADCDPGAYEAELGASVLEIPTLSGIALVVFVLLLAALTVWRLRRGDFAR